MQLSIIVPIHNGEKYLRTCMDSILAQTFRNYELILVDDGSVDASGEICDQYARLDQRVVVYHKENEGVTRARMTGLEKAKGNYIAFVDADDWLEEDFLEDLMEKIVQNHADLVIVGCTKEQAGKQEMVLNRIPDGTYKEDKLRQEIFPQMLYYQGFFQFGILPYMWNKIYKKKLLLPCFENIDANIYDGEDTAIVFTYLLRTSSIVISSTAKYHYRIHSDSATANKRKSYYQNCCYLYLYLYEEFKKTAWFEVLRPQLDQYMRKMIWQISPQSFPLMQEYVFPFHKIPKDARIVLYGAGNVGKIYAHQIRRTGYCEIIFWVDRDYQKPELQALGVAAPERLRQGEYDFVVIAVANDGVIKTIMNVMDKMRIPRDKIIY